MGRYSARGIGNETKIRLSILVQRRGHTDDDGIHFGHARKVCGRAEPLRSRRLDLSRWNSTDVGSTGAESCNLMLVDVKTRYSKFRFRVEQSKWQVPIAIALFPISS